MDVADLLNKLPTHLPETLEDSHRLIKDLIALIKNLCYRIEQVELDNRLLQEQLNLNSHNSSKPPSSDFKKSKKSKKTTGKSSGKRSGGQPGHQGHHRALLDTADVDTVVTCDLEQQCVSAEITTGLKSEY